MHVVVRLERYHGLSMPYVGFFYLVLGTRGCEDEANTILGVQKNDTMMINNMATAEIICTWDDIGRTTPGLFLRHITQAADAVLATI